MERLRAAGIEPQLGHDADQVPEDAEVVVSTAIGEDNPELARARERGQRVLHRGELLAELCAERRLLAVAGTHGKTTTAAMCIHALRAHGRRPGLLPRRRAARRRAGRSRRQRGLGRGRVGCRRGRRERRELPEAAARGRGDHQPRARPPLALELARGARRGLRRLRLAGLGRRHGGRRAAARPGGAARHALRPRAGGRRACAGRGAARDRNRDPADRAAPASAPGAQGSTRRSAWGARPPQRRQRAGGARRSLAGRGRRRRAAPRRSRAFRASRGAWSSRASATARGSTTTTPTTRPRSAAPSRPRASSTAPADRRLPAPPLLAHQGAGDRVRRGARRRRRGRGARRLSGARGAGRPARGRQRPDGRRAPPPTMPAADRSGGCPTPSSPRRPWARGCGEGDLLVTIGAGDIFKLAEALVDGGQRMSELPPASSATTRSRA